MIEYKIIEEKENPLESIIEKTGLSTKFTVQQLIDHLDYTSRMLKQAEGQLDVDSKQDEMSLEILPMLNDIPEDKWQLVMSYAARQVSRPEFVEYIKTCKETIESYETQKAEIVEKFNIKEIEVKKAEDGK